MPALLTRPDPPETRSFSDAAAAVAHVRALYEAETGYLREHFRHFAAGRPPAARVRAYYPIVSLTTESFARIDTRLSYGFVSAPGTYATTVTRPDLFRGYLEEQIGQLIRNHGRPVEVGIGDTPIPVHFAYADGIHIEGVLDADQIRSIRDYFDVPDLALMDDSIVNGTWVGRRASRCRCRSSPRRGSTTRCTGCATTPARVPSTSRTT